MSLTDMLYKTSLHLHNCLGKGLKLLCLGQKCHDPNGFVLRILKTMLFNTSLNRLQKETNGMHVLTFNPFSDDFSMAKALETYNLYSLLLLGKLNYSVGW